MTFLAGCGSTNMDNGAESRDHTTEAPGVIAVETQEDDFIYRLYTDNAIYRKGEKVDIIAELEYIGEEDEVTIAHAASPFYFNLKELNRGYPIEQMMNEPLLHTTLVRGEPLVEHYQKSGGYSEQDDPNYVQFIRNVWKSNGFPHGHYVVDGFASFFVEEEGKTEKKTYNIEGKIDFKVESN